MQSVQSAGTKKKVTDPEIILAVRMLAVPFSRTGPGDAFIGGCAPHRKAGRGRREVLEII